MSELLQKPNLETFSEVAAISLGQASVILMPEPKDEMDLFIEKVEDEQFVRELAQVQVLEKLSAETKELWFEHTGCFVDEGNHPLHILTLREIGKLKDVLMDDPHWPIFPALLLREIIEKTLSGRVVERYFEILRDFIISETGIPPQGRWYLDGLGIAWMKSMLNEKAYQRIKKERRRIRANKRDWCPKCRTHCRQDGGCQC